MQSAHGSGLRSVGQIVKSSRQSLQPAPLHNKAGFDPRYRASRLNTAVEGRRYPRINVELVTDDGLSDIIDKGFDAGVHFGEILAGDMVAVPVGSPQVICHSCCLRLSRGARDTGNATEAA